MASMASSAHGKRSAAAAAAATQETGTPAKVARVGGEKPTPRGQTLQGYHHSGKHYDNPLVARHLYHHSGKHSDILLVVRHFYHHSGKQ